jgi:hypothetical protein
MYFCNLVPNGSTGALTVVVLLHFGIVNDFFWIFVLYFMCLRSMHMHTAYKKFSACRTGKIEIVRYRLLDKGWCFPPHHAKYLDHEARGILKERSIALPSGFRVRKLYIFLFAFLFACRDIICDLYE